MQLDGTEMPIAGSKEIASIGISGSTVTVVTSSPHGYSTNDYIRVLYTDNYTKTEPRLSQITVTNTTTFTYIDADSAGSSSETSGYVITPGNTPNGGGKAIFSIWLRDCNFENVYCHHTPSTGYGTDNHDNVRYINCRADSCGTSSKITVAADQPSGCSGFGMGTAGYVIEDLKIVNCTADYNWNSGYTFEVVPNDEDDKVGHFMECNGCTAVGNLYGFKTHNSLKRANSGVRFISCSANGNVDIPEYVAGTGVSYAGTGFLVWENASNTQVVSCFSWGNEDYGIAVSSYRSRGTIINGNAVFENASDGIRGSGGSFTLSNNVINNNGKHGLNIIVSSSGPVDDVLVTDNLIYNNSITSKASGFDGINIDVSSGGSTDGMIISGNRITDKTPARTITSIVGDGTTVTVEVSDPLNMVSDDWVNITGTTAFNGTDKSITIVHPTKFTYLDTPVATEASGTATRVGTQDRAISLADDVDITSLLINGNSLRGNKRSSLASTSWSNADVTFVDNLTD